MINTGTPRSVNPAASPQPTRQELLQAIMALRQEVEALRREKQNLQLLLEVTMQHSDAMTEDLQSEKEDLAVLLEMNTEHSDAVEEELHQKAEEALRESERRLRLIVQATPVPVLISRVADGEIVYANGMSGPLVGVETEVLLGRNIADFYAEPADYHALTAVLDERGQIDHYEVRIRRADQSLLWAEVSLRSLTFGDQASLLCAIHDITERIAYQNQLKELNEELEVRNRLLGRLGVDIAHGARTPLLNATDISELVPELIEIEEFDTVRTLTNALGEKARGGLALLNQQLRQITSLLGEIQVSGADMREGALSADSGNRLNGSI
jgi:PAS domain S-box-containing protein